VLTESTFTPQHAAVHSNLPNLINTKAEINMSRIQLHPENPPTHLNRYHDYVSTANNYMLQKLYEVPAGIVDQLRFHFIDQYRQKVKVLQIKRGVVQQAVPDDEGNSQIVDVDTFWSFQSLYKIEMELIYEN
jgi:hypothetical protein